MAVVLRREVAKGHPSRLCCRASPPLKRLLTVSRRDRARPRPAQALSNPKPQSRSRLRHRARSPSLTLLARGRRKPDRARPPAAGASPFTTEPQSRSLLRSRAGSMTLSARSLAAGASPFKTQHTVRIVTVCSRLEGPRRDEFRKHPGEARLLRRIRTGGGTSRRGARRSALVPACAPLLRANR
jgi:hypothetical protein